MTDKRDDMIDSVQLPDGSYLDVNENSEVVPESDDYNFDFRDVYDDSNRPLEEGQSRQDHRAPTNSERVWETDEQQIAIEPGRIGLWGTISSGKTTFLAILYHVMNKNGWRIYGTGEDSNSFIVSSYEMVFEDRNFPPPTIEDEVTIYEYELYYDPEDDVEVPQSRNPLLWRRSSRSKPQPKRKFSSEPKDFKLTFIDASGEAFRDPKRWRADNPGILHPFYELRRCEKIICLFDAEPFLPTRRPLESHGKPIRPIEYFKNAIQLFSLLRQNDSNLSRGRIHSYEFAFCISKCDLPEIWEHRENITQFATQVFGTQVINEINEIERYIPPSNYSWHAFSAVGPFYDGSQYETPVTSDLRIRPEHNIQPYGVMDIVTELFRES